LIEVSAENTIQLKKSDQINQGYQNKIEKLRKLQATLMEKFEKEIEKEMEILSDDNKSGSKFEYYSQEMQKLKKSGSLKVEEADKKIKDLDTKPKSFLIATRLPNLPSKEKSKSQFWPINAEKKDRYNHI